MKIVIIGLGAIGTTILKSLSGEGHSITIIDERKDKIEELIERYDVQGVVGNGASLDIQREAGVRGGGSRYRTYQERRGLVNASSSRREPRPSSG